MWALISTYITISEWKLILFRIVTKIAHIIAYKHFILGCSKPGSSTKVILVELSVLDRLKIDNPDFWLGDGSSTTQKFETWQFDNNNSCRASGPHSSTDWSSTTRKFDSFELQGCRAFGLSNFRPRTTTSSLSTNFS